MSDVSRRSVARGLAWATPTLVVGSAAPAMAASACSPTTACAKPTIQIFTGSANPGVWGIGSTGSFAVGNAGTCPFTVTSITFTWHVFRATGASAGYVATSMSSSNWPGGTGPNNANNTTDGVWTNTRSVVIPANTNVAASSYNGNWNGTWYGGTGANTGRYELRATLTGTYVGTGGVTCSVGSVSALVNNNNGTGF